MVKLYHTLGLVAVLTLANHSLAAPVVPAKALGMVDAKVDFCARVDSQSADKYKAWGKLAIAGMSEKEVKDAHESADYKAGYNALTGQLEKVPQEKAVENCRKDLNDATK